eukprot:m.13433 g.13433  ORF g.13433 m.13433 type:complete len:110 (+) comp10156_c0_seq1:97-426(+)
MSDFWGSITSLDIYQQKVVQLDHNATKCTAPCGQVQGTEDWMVEINIRGHIAHVHPFAPFLCPAPVAMDAPIHRPVVNHTQRAVTVEAVAIAKLPQNITIVEVEIIQTC